VEVRLWLAAAVAAYFLFIFGMTRMGLIGPDEPRYAFVGRDMARSGDWVTPRLWGSPWFEKPALLYWTTAAAFRVGLGEDAAPRLPVALLSILFLLFYYFRLRATLGNPAAAYSLALLATSAGWVAYSRVAVFDLPLSAAFGAAMLELLAWLDQKQRRSPILFAAFLGIAVLAKGLVGPVLAALILLCWAARWGARELWGLLRLAPALVFALVAGPWYLLCFARNGTPFLQEFFWRQHFARYTAGALAHNQPVWFFIPVVLIGFLPWTPLVLSFPKLDYMGDRRLFFLAVWVGVAIVFFSFSRDKLPAYVLPAFPAIAALAGVALGRSEPWTGIHRALLPLCAATLALFPIAGAVLPTALSMGLSSALWQTKWSGVLLLAVAVLIAAVILLENRRKREAAIAIICAAAAAGCAWISFSTFPAIDAQAGARSVWQQAQAHRDEICLDRVSRSLQYGLAYYAGRPLADCATESKPYRITSAGIVTASSSHRDRSMSEASK